MKVKGFSIINNEIRVKLDLTFEEYSVLSFIDHWIHNNTDTISYAEYYKYTGITHKKLDEILYSLNKKGFISFDEFINRIEPTNKWKQEFNTDGLIDELWKIHPAGTKAIARERLKNVLKQINFDDLKDKLINYIKDCKEKESFAKNLDTWLNPKNKHWETVVIDRKKTAKSEVKAFMKFKKVE